MTWNMARLVRRFLMFYPSTSINSDDAPELCWLTGGQHIVDMILLMDGVAILGQLGLQLYQKGIEETGSKSYYPTTQIC